MTPQEEEFIKKYFKRSPQVDILINAMPNFNFDEFIEWFMKNKLEIGGGHILEYLKFKGEINDNKNK